MEELILYYGKDTRLVYDLKRELWYPQYRKRKFLGLIPLEWKYVELNYANGDDTTPRSFTNLKTGVHYLKGWNTDKMVSININDIRFT